MQNGLFYEFWWVVILPVLQAMAGIRFGWKGLIASTVALCVAVWVGFELYQSMRAAPPSNVVDLGPGLAVWTCLMAMLAGLVIVGIALFIAHLLLRQSRAR